MMKRWIACLAVFVLLLTMTACAESQTGQKPQTQKKPIPAIAGTWMAQVDYASVINAFIKEEEVLTAAGVFAESAPLELTFTFEENGKVRCEMNEQQLYDALDPVCIGILTPMAEAFGVSLEEYIENSGMTKEELMISVFTQKIIDGMKQAVEFEGVYTLSGDQLTVVTDEPTKTAVILDGNTVTLENAVGGKTNTDEEGQALASLFPLELTKVEQ